MRLLVLIAATLLSGCAGPVTQLAEGTRLCLREMQVSYEELVRGCTAVIQAQQEPPTILAIAYGNRAAGYSATGNAESAIRDFDAAIRLDPTGFQYWNGRCLAKALSDRAREALPDCERSLELKPDEVRLVSARAFVRYLLGDLVGAGNDYDAVLRQHGNASAARYGRAMVREARGNGAGAAEDFAAAQHAAGDPKSWATILNLYGKFRRRI